MQCPIDDAQLVMADRQGIEIDYCPKCRGVWLDRGELDKLIERSEQSQNSSRRADDRDEYRRRQDDDDDDEYKHRQYDDRHDEDRHQGKPRKKESFLGDFFEF